MPLNVTLSMTAEQAMLIEQVLDRRAQQLMYVLHALHITPEEEHAYEQELGMISQLIGVDYGDA